MCRSVGSLTYTFYLARNEPSPQARETRTGPIATPGSAPGPESLGDLDVLRGKGVRIAFVVFFYRDSSLLLLSHN